MADAAHMPPPPPPMTMMIVVVMMVMMMTMHRMLRSEDGHTATWA
jgi:hypothetical protein